MLDLAYLPASGSAVLTLMANRVDYPLSTQGGRTHAQTHQSTPQNPSPQAL